MSSRAVAVRLAMLAIAGPWSWPRPAEGQVTGMPVYSTPYRAFSGSERGLTASFPSSSDVAFEGLYGIGSGTMDIRFRGGLALGSEPTNDVALLVGAEFRHRLITHNVEFPADGALVVGAGATLGDLNNLYVPVGLSLGRRLDVEGSDVSIVPYVQPTMFLVAGDGDEDIGFTLGLGGDFQLTPAFDLRVNVGLGDIDGFSISAVWVR